jgi:hypothetical protein
MFTFLKVSSTVCQILSKSTLHLEAKRQTTFPMTLVFAQRLQAAGYQTILPIGVCGSVCNTVVSAFLPGAYSRRIRAQGMELLISSWQNLRCNLNVCYILPGLRGAKKASRNCTVYVIQVLRTFKFL